MDMIARCACGIEVARLSGSPADLGAAVEATLLACHACQDHIGHAVTLIITGAFEWSISPEAADLCIECLYQHCTGTRRAEHPSVPRELVGAYTIAFHTAHEGHALAVTYGARRWESPPGRAGRAKPT